MSQDRRYHSGAQASAKSGVFSHADLNELISCRDVADVACPACGPSRQSPVNQKREVLRLYQLDNGGISYKCTRCGVEGWAAPDQSIVISPEERARRARIREAERSSREARRQGLVEFLWRKSEPLNPGGAAYTYLRVHRKIVCPPPPQMRWLRPRDEYPGAIVMPFGFIDENTIPVGLHLTRIDADGRKIDKKMLGYGTMGLPLVLAEPEEGSDVLLIGEGIENGLTMHQHTGHGSWAAGSKDRLPPLWKVVPEWARSVFVKYDRDADGGGLIRARELVTLLRSADPSRNAQIF